VLPLLLLFAACEKKAPPASAAPPPGMPPIEGTTAVNPDKPEHLPTTAVGGNGVPLPANHPALPAGHPQMPGMPPADDDIDPKAATPGNVEFDPKSVVSGVLRLDDKVKAKVKEGDAVFLVARQADPGGGPGPILAVKKLIAGKWPAPFQLDNRDAMMTGTKLGGKVVVSVRVDKDGDAITKNPGDVTGASRPLDVPSEKVVVTLDTVL
jgi:hypothetical protein